MDTQRITISLPGYLYEHIKKNIPERKVSSFVASVVEEKLLSTKKIDPVEAFFNLRKTLPKMSLRKIIAAIEEGRP